MPIVSEGQDSLFPWSSNLSHEWRLGQPVEGGLCFSLSCILLIQRLVFASIKYMRKEEQGQRFLSQYGDTLKCASAVSYKAHVL